MTTTRYTGPERRKPVLIVQHAEHEHPAAVRRALESQGIQSLWLHPYRGETYPLVSEISGMISLGGPMGANDEAEHPWIRRECELLRESVLEGLPVVGICLGGQMLARAMGGRVEKNDTVEVGWFPIQINSEGQNDPVIGAAGKAPMVYHWHGDTFHPPKDAILLAESKACPRQAYRLSEKVYGFQFHPEADHQLIHEWLAIEGVEDEIHAVQQEHGPKTVQDASTQKDRSFRGERASLKITAAIGSLFRKRSVRGLPRGICTQVNDFATHQNTVLVTFEGSHRKHIHLRGKINSLLTIPAGKFIILHEDTTLLWPIRLDDVIEIKSLD